MARCKHCESNTISDESAEGYCRDCHTIGYEEETKVTQSELTLLTYEQGYERGLQVGRKIGRREARKH